MLFIDLKLHLSCWVSFYFLGDCLVFLFQVVSCSLVVTFSKHPFLLFMDVTIFLDLYKAFKKLSSNPWFTDFSSWGHFFFTAIFGLFLSCC